MGRIDKIKEQNPNMEVSLIDLINILIPESKPKYISLALKMVDNNMERISNHSNDFMQSMINEFGIEKSRFSNLSKYQKVFLIVLEIVLKNSDIEYLRKFIQLNEKGLIENKDITSYKTTEEIVEAISIAELKNLKNELSKEVLRLYENDDWLIIKPLSWLASQKYGSSTKWCTSMEKSPEYFLRYTKEGILIYCLNKKTGKHVGVYKKLVYDIEISFWDIYDKRIDSMESGLPFEIINLLKEELNTVNTNYDLLTDKQKQSLQETILEWEMSKQIKYDEDEVPTPIGDNTEIPIIANNNYTLGRLVPMTGVNGNDGDVDLNF